MRLTSTIVMFCLLIVPSLARSSFAQAYNTCDIMQHYNRLAPAQQICVASYRERTYVVWEICPILKLRERALPDVAMKAICRPNIGCSEPHDTFTQTVTHGRHVRGRVGGTAASKFKLELLWKLVEDLSVTLGAEPSVGAQGDLEVSESVTMEDSLVINQMDCHDKRKTFTKIKLSIDGTVEIRSEVEWTTGPTYITAEGGFAPCVEGLKFTTVCEIGSTYGKLGEVTQLEIGDQQTPCCHPLSGETEGQPCCNNACHP